MAGHKAQHKARHKDIFYAFPSEPPSLGETITNAIQVLRQSPITKTANVRFKLWPETNTAGKQLIQSVVQNIERAEIFACDLTYPNSNVAFELGYSIGQFKRIWVSLDVGIENASREYRRVYFGLLGLSYAEYQNHIDLGNALLINSPWTNIDQTPLGQVYRKRAALQEKPTLLYLKPPLDTEAAITTIESLRKSIFADSLIIDDPNENPSPTLEWYAEKIRTADAVAIQLLSSDHHGNLHHNVKCSIIAGLAWSFRKPLLMLAQSPFVSPIDYQHLLKTHDTAQQCETFLKTWMGELEPKLPRRRSRRPQESSSAGLVIDLRKLSIGDPVAENESQNLDTYFVETSAYFHAMSGQTTIMVGRRGTGKTANLYAMRTELSGNKMNHVCVIKPVGYEIDGLVRVLEEIIHRSEQGYLIESLWKFLIYSELAISVFDEICLRPIHQEPTSDEVNFCEYFKQNHRTLSIPFSERFDGAIKSLFGLGNLSDAASQRARISEELHNKQIRDLRWLLWCRMSIVDTKAFTLPPARRSISGHTLLATGSPA